MEIDRWESGFRIVVPPLQGSAGQIPLTQGCALGYFLSPRWGSGDFSSHSSPCCLENVGAASGREWGVV